MCNLLPPSLPPLLPSSLAVPFLELSPDGFPFSRWLTRASADFRPAATMASAVLAPSYLCGLAWRGRVAWMGTPHPQTHSAWPRKTCRAHGCTAAHCHTAAGCWVPLLSPFNPRARSTGKACSNDGQDGPERQKAKPVPLHVFPQQTSAEPEPTSVDPNRCQLTPNRRQLTLTNVS